MAEFRDWWQQNHSENDNNLHRRTNRKKPVPPDGTKIKFLFKNKEHHGEYMGGKIVLTGDGGKSVTCSSLSDASVKLTNTSRNGWRDWFLLLPNQDHWILADDWRREQIV